MNEYIITEESANKILAYLGNKPFVEVANLINDLKSIKKLELTTDKKNGKNS